MISRVADALDFLDALNTDDVFELAVDSYVWWDLDLAASCHRAELTLHFRSNWLRNLRGRFDRGMPGDGMIDNGGFANG